MLDSEWKKVVKDLYRKILKFKSSSSDFSTEIKIANKGLDDEAEKKAPNGIRMKNILRKIHGFVEEKAIVKKRLDNVKDKFTDCILERGDYSKDQVTMEEHAADKPKKKKVKSK